MLFHQVSFLSQNDQGVLENQKTNHQSQGVSISPEQQQPGVHENIAQVEWISHHGVRTGFIEYIGTQK